MPMVNEIHIKPARVKHAKDREAVFSYEGKTYRPDKEGVVTIPDCLLPEAKEHNFHLIRSKKEIEKEEDKTESAMTAEERELAGLPPEGEELKTGVQPVLKNEADKQQQQQTLSLNKAENKA